MKKNIEHKKTILIIDDEEAIRKVLNIHLSNEGYQIILSSGGKDVFEVLEKKSYDLVISDINMPEVNGVRVLEDIKKRSDTVPIIMLTGVMELTIAVDVMKKGAFDYLIKPIRKETLIHTIKRAFAHKDLLERNKKLEEENRKNLMFLEKRVKERTQELHKKNKELEVACAKLKTINIQMVNAFAETIEAKDKHTHGHCSRLRDMALRLGNHLDLSQEELTIIEYAAILHDLGKIKVMESVLNKPGSLTEEEYKHIKEHSAFGEKILRKISVLEPVAEIIGAHHEHFNGNGYPKGLKGEEIPIEARIISLVDTFDAMISDRPYRKGIFLEKALNEINRVSGTQLDPALVNTFLENKLYINEQS